MMEHPLKTRTNESSILQEPQINLSYRYWISTPFLWCNGRISPSGFHDVSSTISWQRARTLQCRWSKRSRVWIYLNDRCWESGIRRTYV